MTNGGVESEVKKALLIDLENCPNKLNNLNSDLVEYSEVLICFTHGEPKIPLEWLSGLSGALQTGKLRIQRMIKAGKNAADFGIAFHAGQMMARLPVATHFEIISNDHDLDHVVNLLKEHDRSAERIGVKPADKNKSVDENLKDYCLHLLNHTKTRPAKKTT